MTGRRTSVDGICYAAEGMAGTAATAGLRRLTSLIDAAPSGRLFAAISTLTEMSAKATRSLEDGQVAMAQGDDHRATLKLARALTQMDDLATTATAGRAGDEAPAFLRKAR